MHDIQAERSTSASPHSGQSSTWHAIRPWTPHLTLAVREITSVSVTFILSSVLDARVSAASANTDGADAEQTFDQVSSTSGSASVITATSSIAVSPVDSHRPVLADILTQELSVDVNGSSWKHFILHVPDAADEAIVLIYGLHPGRQYDIDIALVGGGMVGRRMVVTNDVTESGSVGQRNEENSAISVDWDVNGTASVEVTPTDTIIPPMVGSLPMPETTFSPSPDPSSPVSHSPSPSTTPTPTTLTQTHEDRLRALSSTLSALNEEQATLQSLLKSTRRDAQKTSTALRSEVDILRRASEKAVIAEGRARQRVRALEDAVKKANEGREDIEREIEQNESSMPALRERETSAEDELKRTKAEADGVRVEREKKEEEERKRKESMRAESVSLTQRTERLNVKRERLEGSVIPDLEAQLAEIELKIELVGRGGRQHQADEIWDGDSRAKSQRRKSHPGTIGRSRSNTMQKPAPPSQTNQTISPPAHLPRHQPRSQSTYHKGLDGGLLGLASPPGFSFQNGSMHASIPSTHTTSATPVSSGLGQSGNLVFSTSSSTTSLPRSTGSAMSSTLSSKAPPFEPTRNLRTSFPLPYSTTSMLSGGGPSLGTEQNTFGPLSSATANIHPFSANGSAPNAATFVTSPTSLVFSSSPSGGGTLPAPIQRPSHTLGSTSSSSSQNSTSVTAQLLRLGRPAPVTLPKTANGENRTQTSG